LTVAAPLGFVDDPPGARLKGPDGADHRHPQFRYLWPLLHCSMHAAVRLQSRFDQLR
jgi:hypothetical protein